MFDMTTKLLSLYSASSTSSNKPDSTSLALLFMNISDLVILFIFQLAHTAGHVEPVNITLAWMNKVTQVIIAVETMDSAHLTQG